MKLQLQEGTLATKKKKKKLQGTNLNLATRIKTKDKLHGVCLLRTSISRR